MLQVGSLEVDIEMEFIRAHPVFIRDEHLLKGGGESRIMQVLKNFHAGQPQRELWSNNGLLACFILVLDGWASIFPL